MKLLVYYSTFALALAISLLLMRCKEDSAPVEPQEDFPLIEQQHQISDEFVKNLQTTTLDSAYQRTLTWAKNQSYVSNASRVFNGVHIEYTSGLMGAVVFYQLPGQGEIEIKYGQEKSKEVNKINDPAKTVHSPAIVNNGTVKKPFDITDEKIGNQKVLIWAPYESVFKTDMRTSLEPIINNANVKLQLTVQADNSCTVSSFQKITDYGLIIIDSHGSEGKYILTNEKYNSSNYLTYRGWINNGSIEVWTEIIRDRS